MNALMHILFLIFISIKTFALNDISLHQNQDNIRLTHGPHTQSSPLVQPKYQLVGYLESWGNIGIEEAISQNYTMLVIAFGTVNDDKIGMNLNCGTSNPEGCFLPSVQWFLEPPRWAENFKKSIGFAHSKGVKVLLSFGGANNTFKPRNANPAILAQNMVNYLHQFDLDGIDFDLENIPYEDLPIDIPYRASYLSELIQHIKLLDKKLIISCAPQINPVQLKSGVRIQWVNTGNETIYNQAIETQLFDYIFAQAYNTPGFSVDNQCNVQWQAVDDETYPQFISKIAPCLEKLLPNHSNTKIMIGEPANLSARAGFGALVHGSYTDMAYAYQTLKNLPSFGGAMTWSINEDSQSSDNNGLRIPYSFSTTISPVLSFH